MKLPPAIKPAKGPGPDYDPIDLIVQNLENIQSFLSRLDMNLKDINYLNSHLPGILSLRRTLSQELEMLADEPYNYSRSRLKALHEENEKIFIYLEGAVGSMIAGNEEEFKKSVKAVEEILLKFDQNLTP